MDDFLKMDVFFVVTTAVVLIGGVICMVALYYLIRVLRSVDRLMKNISEESDNIREDIALLRAKAREEGMKWKHLLDFFFRIASRNRSRKARTKEEKAGGVHGRS